jgi:hypothetical protein
LSLGQLTGFALVAVGDVEDVEAGEVAGSTDVDDAVEGAAGGWLAVDVHAVTAATVVTAVTAAVAASRADGRRREGFVMGVTTFAGPAGKRTRRPSTAWR